MSLLPAPTVLPAVGDEWVLYQDTAGVHAIELTADAPRPRMLVASTQPQGATPAPAVSRGRAYAVVPVKAGGRPEAVANKLVALDLARDGAMLFEQSPTDENAIFMGTPLVASGQVVACELSPQEGMKASLAAYDAWTGALRWRRSLGFAFDPSLMAGSPSLGIALTSEQGVVYVSTQLGMVAALELNDGEPRWLRTYPRAFPGGEAAVILNRARRPNPPLVAGSRVFVAADDSGRVAAFDATSGADLWSNQLPSPEARLLTVDGDRLVLTGDRLWALDVETGNLDPVWGEELTSGAGQGVVAGDVIVWPTTLSIALVDRATGKLTNQTIPLTSPGGANVVVHSSHSATSAASVDLMAATAMQLLIFRGDADAADVP
jgi:outer membrane protein assembly factor BamB